MLNIQFHFKFSIYFHNNNWLNRIMASNVIEIYTTTKIMHTYRVTIIGTLCNSQTLFLHTKQKQVTRNVGKRM